MKSIDRLRNWATTIPGLIFFALAGYSAYTDISNDIDVDKWEIAALSVLGWVFLWAKNSLLEGIFLSVFKIK